MLLRDGGKYVNRLGDLVTIKWRGNLAYPFTDLSGVHTYNENGSVFELNDPSDEDLVAEYKEPEETSSYSVISKAALAEYIRNRLAVLESRYEADDRYKASEALFAMDRLTELCDEFGIKL